MIDMHCHILPGVDDGARNIVESLDMLKEAERVGFNNIIVTPHYFEGYYEVDEKRRIKVLDSLKAQMNFQKIAVSLYTGNEIYITENTMENIKSKKASTLNNTPYVLIEFDLNTKPMNILNLIYKILKEKDIPILAHPERYKFIQDDPMIAYELVQNGVLMQCNYGSFVGYYGEKAKILAKKFLKSNMVHFLGTDAHRPKTLYPMVPRVMKELNEFIGKAKVDEITDSNPRKVLFNQYIEIDDPIKPKFSLIEKLKLGKK